MATLNEATTISTVIARDPREVYAFVANPANVPRWARGLGTSIACVDGRWVAQTPRGPVAFRFATHNEFGVLDHYVSPAPGVEIYVPMRVVAAGDGSLVMLTLFRQPGMSAAEFARDQELVRADLQVLKDVLEGDAVHTAPVRTAIHQEHDHGTLR